jgi:hypothetical protein
MKRDEQIRKALSLLAPPAKSRAECRADIEAALDILEWFGKGDKANQAERSAAANRARNIFHKTIRKALREYDAMVKAGYSGLLYPTDPENPFRGLDGRVLLQWLTTETAPPRKWVMFSLLSPKKPIPDILPDDAGLSVGSGKKNRAAEDAHWLLTKWGHDAGIVTTRGGTWHKLAAILYGDEQADLFQYLRVSQISSTVK